MAIKVILICDKCEKKCGEEIIKEKRIIDNAILNPNFECSDCILKEILQEKLGMETEST